MSGLDEAGQLQHEWPTHPAGEKPKLEHKSIFRELPFLIAVAIGIALLVKTFLVQAFYIPSESMEPTLHGCAGCRGDRVLVNRLVYRFRAPRRGEIIVFTGKKALPDTRGAARKLVDFLTEGLGVARPSDTDFIKRIIGLPGETIEMRKAVVTITRTDGRKIQLGEPYVKVPDDRPFGPFHVPAGEFFMMGDNRTHSDDSRFDLGTIPRGDIIGKAFVKIWPPGRWGRMARASYPGDAVGALLVLGMWGRRRRAPGILISEEAS